MLSPGKQQICALVLESLKTGFDGWTIPAGRSTIAEVYPALWSRSFANEGRTGDLHDAFSIAACLSLADRDGSLAGFLTPDLAPPERTLAQVEGWILGVPGLLRVRDEVAKGSPAMQDTEPRTTF
jgi:hypothetical protein